MFLYKSESNFNNKASTTKEIVNRSFDIKMSIDLAELENAVPTIEFDPDDDTKEGK